MENPSNPPIIRLNKKGKLRRPNVIAGPGQNCKNSSAASCRAIAAILNRGKDLPDGMTLDQCLAESCHKDYLQP